MIADRRSVPISDAHPTRSGWQPDRARLRLIVEQRLRANGVEHPAVGAAIQQARGRAGTSIRDFAAAVGVDPSIVASAESGVLGQEFLPEKLREIAFLSYPSGMMDP